MGEYVVRQEEPPVSVALPAARCPHCKNLQHQRAFDRGFCDSCARPLPKGQVVETVVE